MSSTGKVEFSRRIFSIACRAGALALLAALSVMAWCAIDGADDAIRNMEPGLEAEKLIASARLLFRIGIASLASFGISFALVLRGARKTAKLAGDLEDVSRFLIHDLRTPLGHISNDADAIVIGRGEPVEKAASIKEECAALLDRIETYSEITRNEAGLDRDAVEDVDFASVVAELAEYFGLLAKDRGMAFECDVPSTPVVVRAHEHKVRMLVGGLLDNAVKYTEKGTVSVSLNELGRKVELVVSDTGRGMTKDQQSKMYLRLYRAEPRGPIPGDGLGLAAVRSIVDFYRGSIRCRSRPGVGTTFTVTFSKKGKIHEQE